MALYPTNIGSSGGSASPAVLYTYYGTTKSYTYTADGSYEYIICVTGGQYVSGQLTTTGTIVAQDTITAHLLASIIKVTPGDTVTPSIATSAGGIICVLGM